MLPSDGHIVFLPLKPTDIAYSLDMPDHLALLAQANIAAAQGSATTAQSHIQAAQACLFTQANNAFDANAPPSWHDFHHDSGSMMTGENAHIKRFCMRNPTYRAEMGVYLEQEADMAWLEQLSDFEPPPEELQARTVGVKDRIGVSLKRSRDDLARLACQILSAPAVSFSLNG